MAKKNKKPGFLQKLFGSEGEKNFSEKDNRGTRHKNEAETVAYWNARMRQTEKEPFVIYTFDSEESARKALLEIPCIHKAEDSGNLICTETLNYGYYKVQEGYFDAIVCGWDLTHDLWDKAKTSFINHGGRPRGQGDLEPKTKTAKPTKKKTGKVEYVTMQRTAKDLGTQIVTFTYEIYKGPDAATAKDFLSKKPVNKQHYYIIVETPEGNYGRDIDGIYKE